MNYLELCNYLIRRVSIAGAHVDLTSVSEQTGRMKLVTDWIRESDLDVQRAWNDWTFHNREFEIVVETGSQFIDENTDGWMSQVARFNENSFSGRTSPTHRQPIMHEPWDFWRNRRGRYRQNTSGIPYSLTVDPSGRIQFVPTDVTWVLNCEVHVKPYPMTGDASTSPIPEEYREIIMHGAAVKYGMFEEADNIRAYHQFEYDRLMQQLESVCLPNQDRTNLSMDEAPLVVTAL